MAFKKRLPSAHSDYDNYDDNQNRSSQNQGAYTSGSKESLFSDNFELKIDYKSEQVFDFDSYKHKIINIMEVFREDILNLKSNLMHLFTIADKQVHKDYHDLTNELVALSQIKLEAAISKSSAYLKNFEEETLSRKILNKLSVDSLRNTIRNGLGHFKDEIESYLTEDKYYRKSTFAISDLALQLEKAFKIYDVLNEEGGIFNYIKVDEVVLYDQIFQNNLEIDFNILIHLNVPLLKDRLKAENMYRTGAATTKERLMFRISEISDKDPADYSLTSITSFIKTLLLREKFNLKHNLVNSFQKNLPKGLELQGDSERVRKEIREELDGLKESIAYLESQNKSYIKIITGNYNPEFIQSMSHTITNIDVLIDIERLFAIIQDITLRIKGLLGKVREFNEIEKRDVSQSVEHSLNLVLEGLQKNVEGKFDLRPIIDEIFSTIENLIQQEKEGRDRFMAEKKKIDAERKELESYVDNLAVSNKESREASGVKPAGGSALKFQKEEAWKKDEPPKRDTYQAREQARRDLHEEEENKRDTVSRDVGGFSKTTKAEFEDTKKYEPYSYSTKAAESKKPEPIKKEEPKYEPKKWDVEPKRDEPKKVEPIKKEEPKKEEPKYEPKKWDVEPKRDEPKKVEPIKKEEPKKEEPKFEPKKWDEPKKVEPIKMPEPVKKEEPKKIETKPYSSAWNQKEQLTPKSPDEIYDAVDEINKQLQDSSVDLRPKEQNKIPNISTKPDTIKPKTNFWDNEEDVDDLDVKPVTTNSNFKKEEPKKEEPKKEDPKKKNSGFWDNDFEEEDLQDTEPVSKPDPFTKKPEPLKPIDKKAEPLSIPKQEPPKPEPKKEEPKKEEPKKVEKKPTWDEDIMDEFDDIQITSGSRQPSAKGNDPKSLMSPASGQTSAVKDPIGSVFEKLETKKEEPKNYKGKPKDEDEIDEYIDDFESSSPDKGLESSEKILESGEKFGDKKIIPQPVKDFTKKPEVIKADSNESLKSEEDRKPAAQSAQQAFKWPSIVSEDKLTLNNEYLEQEASVFGQPVNPEAFNNTQVLVCLLQEFIAQNKVFIFDFPETEMILNEMGEDPLTFKRNKFPAEVISEVANAMKGYYLEVLPNLSAVAAKGRFYIPFAIDDPSLPNLVEIDFANKVFCLIYGNPVGTDKGTTAIANEFHALIRDIIAQILEPADARALNNFKLVKVGCTPTSEAVLQSVSAQVYLRVMLYVFYLDYEIVRNPHELTINFDEGLLQRFFCSLKSACTLKEVVESDIWPQYAENFVKTSEQLSDGKECLIEHKNYDMKPNEYDKLSNLIGKELGLLFGRLSKGLKEIYLALDVNQGDQKKSVYYIFMTSTPDPSTTTKKYKAIAFMNAENDEEFDNRIDKVMKTLDKANNTDVAIYKDYLRHYLNVQFSDVTLGVWILLVKQNQFTPEEAMALITYNMNPYHLDLQEEGEDPEGQGGYGYGDDGEGGEGEYYDDGDGELPIDEIDDNNF